MSKCCLKKCTNHFTCERYDHFGCYIPLYESSLVINGTRVVFQDSSTTCLYEVTTPFTQDELICLNAIDNKGLTPLQTAQMYVRELKFQREYKDNIEELNKKAMKDAAEITRLECLIDVLTQQNAELKLALSKPKELASYDNLDEH